MEETLLKINNIFNERINGITGNFRKRILDIRDAILFRFKYSEVGVTKESIAAEINYDKNIKCDATVYTKKEDNIPLSFYQLLFYDIQKYYTENFTNKNYYKCEILNVTPMADAIVVAVDGTYSNTNISAEKGKLETSMNICSYNVSYGIPLLLDLKGREGKNKEIASLYEILKEEKIEKNVILVADRAYTKYELFKKLADMSINYVIRLRDNCLIGKEISGKQSTIMKYLNENTRIVDSEYEETKILQSRDKKKHKVKFKNKCKLVTNLMDTTKYTDEIIRQIYKQRWSIEVFFKILKTNFKFRTSVERKPDNYAKQYYSELIIYYISKMLSHAKTTSTAKQCKLNKIKYKNKKNGQRIKCPIRYNQSLIITGIFRKLIDNIIYSSLTDGMLKSFFGTYIKNIKNEPDRHFDRKSKLPFSKWYVKFYHEVYKYAKIINAKINNDPDKLNKNLKLLYKDITIA